MAREQRRRSTMESILTQGSQDLVSQWEIIMRRFSEDCKNLNHRCSVISPEFPCEKLPLQRFITGSTYDGTWDALGMSGHGIYTFPNGVIYEGEFLNGEFHGPGELRYPDGNKVLGIWIHGKIKQRTVVFEDGVKYKEKDWKYCMESDRRYAAEYHNRGIKPTGDENCLITASLPTKKIPEAYYDVGDGFYNPRCNSVFSYDDPTKIERCPGKKQHDWILQNCRSNPEPMGPCPALYANQPTDPEIELPNVPLPATLLSRAGSQESLRSFGKRNIGETWSRMLARANQKSKGWKKRVIQFNPDN